MTTEQILLGVALTLILAVGSQIVASRLRLPALIVLLPVGFTAGAMTDLVHPEQLLGAAFEPLVSLSVAIILYDAALGLNLSHLRGHTRSVVTRLIVFGATVTCGCAALLAMWLFGMSWQVALMIGAILVVSGPTVVGPLLNFVRPKDRLQRILSWEGSLIDPVGGILGALVFHAISTGSRHTLGDGMVRFATSIGLGLVGGVLGAGVLWLVLVRLRLAEVLGTAAQLAVVVAVAAVCDVLRDDTGLIAAIVMGLALANLPIFDASARRPFFETLVHLILGVLFISISATVTPASLNHLVLPALAFVAFLVAFVRPVVAAISTARTDLSTGERAFIGWMAPRGIVAAATASTFAPALVATGLPGASKILPITFLIIVMTVVLYGLSAAPMARRLGVVRAARSRPLLIGGEPWVIELGRALRAAGLEIVMWAGPSEQRTAIQAAGIELAPGELITDATDPGAQVEGVTSILLLTGEDDFNALAAALVRGNIEGPVYRLRPPSGSHGVLSPEAAGPVLFGPALTRDALQNRFHAGEHTVTSPAETAIPPGHDLLFRVRADGSLAPVTGDGTPDAQPGDTLVLLGRDPDPADSPLIGQTTTGDRSVRPPS
jgi:NhaP-type Na+/H+ or K+/H+ antiporter